VEKKGRENSGKLNS